MLPCYSSPTVSVLIIYAVIRARTQEPPPFHTLPVSKLFFPPNSLEHYTTLQCQSQPTSHAVRILTPWLSLGFSIHCPLQDFPHSNHDYLSCPGVPPYLSAPLNTFIAPFVFEPKFYLHARAEGLPQLDPLTTLWLSAQHLPFPLCSPAKLN